MQINIFFAFNLERFLCPQRTFLKRQLFLAVERGLIGVGLVAVDFLPYNELNFQCVHCFVEKGFNRSSLKDKHPTLQSSAY